MRAYRTPALAWAGAFAGLVLALVADGVADLVATALVAAPLLLVAGHVRAARRQPPGKP
ncbi:MAG: hypothetical protein AAGH15_20910 [Myxococcota bacterium]